MCGRDWSSDVCSSDLLLLLVAVFIGLFGVPYLRIQHDRIFITYSNGFDGFECYGDFAPLITLVPEIGRASCRERV